MRHGILNAIFTIAISAIPTWANAQNAYRCGNSYSQTPCADGKTLDLSDNRTLAQKNQATAAAANRSEEVAALQKARLAREKRELTAKKTPAGVIAPAAAPAGVSVPSDKSNAKRRKKAAAEFAAPKAAKGTAKQPSKAGKAGKAR